MEFGEVVLQPVILSGGSGTRLWPLSREQYPKQLLQLTCERSMLQETARRVDGLSKTAALRAPIIVCNEAYRFITAEQMLAAGKPSSQIVLEPFGRNTAPALTLAALVAMQSDADPVLLAMPADHVISNVAAFEAAVASALPLAADGGIVTFGIVPDRAETGYGYIRTGQRRTDGVALALTQFVEKPDNATAQRYLESGEYLWNSGLFVLRASAWIQALARFQPTMLEACRAAIEGGRTDVDFRRIDAAAFEACPSDSVDYAVMEPLSAAQSAEMPCHVIPLSAGWSDVGSWESLWQVSEKDDAGNVTRGDVLMHNARDNLIFAEDCVVACVGVDDLIVVETPDAVLVAHKDATQDVKHIVSRLKVEQFSQANTHRKVHRPWGWYDSIDAGQRFQVKRIVVKPGASLSLQMHHHRAEHWVVVHGTAKVTRGDETILLSENQSTYIPLGTVHRLENPGKFDLEIIEVQSGSYLGEDDIVRFEDTYGRTNG
ncbi:mannose-1-phosphate guanylyltransferase [Pandoraea communis]|uniref:mannose-1-phosphate guanylyltransferase n=1 Tax=Pandoraea communis TaxID=2508297 RepID=A0A5E4T7D3_9BURK|nr:mannose-1-phosphate guanylyltransferase/mannose-6-phosphate isomerase [Pandoraea communis]VVD82478.1 mannose-1-phosphate guanylyltransferase [Pandoraea communis]